jgi:chromosome segregation ATPase
MSKFGGFFARNAGLFNIPSEPTPASTDNTPSNITALPDNPLELDEELFSALGAQIGGENESLRNLMLDATAKIAELDTIKAAVGKLADPLSKTLRALEAEKSEKISIQTVLNNTRTAYGKLRNEVAELEKKTATSDKECKALRQELATTQSVLRTTETTKAEISIDIAARRAQIAELEARLAQETGETRALRDENRRLDERLSVTDKRIIALESDLNAARQRLLMAEDEKRAQQTSLTKASADAARLSRKLAETEASLNATHGRLRHVEANFVEVNTERSRLVTALDQANEHHEHEITSQHMRFDALQARATATENLLGEAREHLLARAEDIRGYDRRFGELAMERDGLHARVSELEAERIQRDSEFTEVDQARNTFMDRSTTLARAYTMKEAALGRAEDANISLNERIAALEANLANEKQSAENTIHELNAAVQREKLERAVVEGALESGRKDFARLMREVMTLQREQQAAEAPARQRAANAA